MMIIMITTNELIKRKVDNFMVIVCLCVSSEKLNKLT